MKSVAIGFLSLLFLTQCSESATENTTAERLIRSWKNVADENTIEFDRANNYTIRFGSDTAFNCNYQVGTLKESSKLFIRSGHVTLECAYQFLEGNQLELTRINPPKSSTTDQMVSIYRRIP